MSSSLSKGLREEHGVSIKFEHGTWKEGKGRPGGRPVEGCSSMRTGMCASGGFGIDWQRGL